jgi:endonuclease/exonuclease/phosphatase family metal-dependent hydrolase
MSPADLLNSFPLDHLAAHFAMRRFPSPVGSMDIFAHLRRLGPILLLATVWPRLVWAQPDTAAAGREANDDFVVATWNLEWFFDDYRGDNFSDLSKEQSAPSRPDWEWKRDGVAAAIAQMRPDVIALQEVEGQRALYYLTQSLRRNHQAKFAIGFTEGTDYFTEQDVGFLIRDGVDMTRLSRYRQSRAMWDSGQFHNVSKHAEVVVEVPVGEGVERVTIMTVHFRARPEQAETRTRQARLVHAWLADRIAAGESVIVLGDTNSEATDYPPVAGTDMGALAGRETPRSEDDLIDLGGYLAEDQRGTHLLPGKHYDRVLVSPALVEDDPQRSDLVFSSIRRVESANVRGAGVDSRQQHWDGGYWNFDAAERDISDHIPVLVRFSVR